MRKHIKYTHSVHILSVTNDSKLKGQGCYNSYVFPSMTGKYNPVGPWDYGTLGLGHTTLGPINLSVFGVMTAMTPIHHQDNWVAGGVVRSLRKMIRAVMTDINTGGYNFNSQFVLFNDENDTNRSLGAVTAQ